jgi:hypothetical protein
LDNRFARFNLPERYERFPSPIQRMRYRGGRLGFTLSPNNGGLTFLLGLKYDGISD